MWLGDVIAPSSAERKNWLSLALQSQACALSVGVGLPKGAAVEKVLGTTELATHLCTQAQEAPQQTPFQTLRRQSRGGLWEFAAWPSWASAPSPPQPQALPCIAPGKFQ